MAVPFHHRGGGDIGGLHTCDGGVDAGFHIGEGLVVRVEHVPLVHIFGVEDLGDDPIARVAGHEQGAASILVGAAANQSLVSGRRISLSELVSLKPGARRLSELT